jgi:hypothetical protein
MYDIGRDPVESVRERRSEGGDWSGRGVVYAGVILPSRVCPWPSAAAASAIDSVDVNSRVAEPFQKV